MKPEIISELKRLAGSANIKENEILAGHVTFKTGGPADVFVVPKNRESVIEVIKFLKRTEVPFFILGNGSNVLIGDRGFRGAVVHMGSDHAEMITDPDTGVIWAQSGISLAKVSREACKNGLTGMEFASGIPGTVGGAVVMNAGAYGGEMKQIVTSVSMLDMESGQCRDFSCEDMRFSYRDSIVKHGPYLVLDVKLKLGRGNTDEIKARMEELKDKRNEKQPLDFPSAGSTFKRPEGYFAGKLIEDSGLKGYSVGGAQVSEKHCGFVINRKGASSADIRKLIEDVQRIVYERQGVRLETEVLMIGEF
ncbi:MAG: UDP-N-acetylmuramate dehydrogenase [Lachnospiraceae bacterium]|nr:UDP-N-acetylmuramate dehydrogenase [Lachnospiraceae bacterium]